MEFANSALPSPMDRVLDASCAATAFRTTARGYHSFAILYCEGVLADIATFKASVLGGQADTEHGSDLAQDTMAVFQSPKNVFGLHSLL